jgi:TPR repeat protein
MSSDPTPEGYDPDTLIRLRMPAAEAGDITAMLLVSVGYLQKEDRATGELWARRAADSGSARGMIFLAQILEQHGDQAGAEQWNRRAEEAQRRTPAGRSRARLRAPLVERFGEEPDPQEVRAAAEAGDVLAMSVLGGMLIQEDPQQAVRWLTPSAEAGDTLAMSALGGLLLAQGDIEGAGRWLERAAESGESVMMDIFGEFAALIGDEQRARYWKDRARAAMAAEDDTTGPQA